jgi:hypothetical protein
MRTSDSDKNFGEFPQPAELILYNFLDHWLAWAEGDAEHLQPYSRRTGLCDNFWEYARNCKLSTWESCSADRLLQDAFVESGLDSCYPFGEDDFYERVDQANQHEDEERLTWVRNYLQENQDN